MDKILPLGRQEFSEVIGDNCIYVDKTKYIFHMIQQKYFFLSRPRRFGKSLLCNTLKELFAGNKQLFKGLWIYDKYDWDKKYPVLKISFSRLPFNVVGLAQAIENELLKISQQRNVKLSGNSYPEMFEELISKLAGNEKVVVIIDEYDKPIVDYLKEPEKAENNREILQNFYSVVKDLDKKIKFFFITGVSKFSQVSIFSKLNNLTDITLHRDYSELLGWTENEVTHYFKPYIQNLSIEYKDVFQDIMPVIRKRYNGYSWDGERTVYNPVSLMNLFSKMEFGNYWFETGTPTFLMQTIKEKRVSPLFIEKSKLSETELDKYEINNVSIIALLFQTGYLTIKQKDKRTGKIKLGYPNSEVEEAFSKYLLAELSTGAVDITASLLFDIVDALAEDDLNTFFNSLNILLKNIPYSLLEDKESYYHSLFYLVVKLVGFHIDAEILTIDGRIDCVISTENIIYIIEFKVGQSAQKALQQIKDKGYAKKYGNDKRIKSMVGVNFDSEKRIVDEWLEERI